MNTRTAPSRPGIKAFTLDVLNGSSLASFSHLSLRL